MCCDTKRKIADGLLVVWAEKPLKKITVQDIMMQENMKRQSFYYHFQDIQDVLVWHCEQQLAVPLKNADELTFEEWMVQALNIVYQDRGFYRQILGFADQAFVFRFCKDLLCPRVAQVLFGEGSTKNLNERQEFILDVVTRGILSYLPDVLSSRRELDEREARARLRYLLETMGLNGEVRPVR